MRQRRLRAHARRRDGRSAASERQCGVGCKAFDESQRQRGGEGIPCPRCVDGTHRRRRRLGQDCTAGSRSAHLANEEGEEP